MASSITVKILSWDSEQLCTNLYNFLLFLLQIHFFWYVNKEIFTRRPTVLTNASLWAQSSLLCPYKQWPTICVVFASPMGPGHLANLPFVLPLKIPFSYGLTSRSIQRGSYTPFWASCSSVNLSSSFTLIEHNFVWFDEMLSWQNDLTPRLPTTKADIFVAWTMLKLVETNLSQRNFCLPVKSTKQTLSN